MPLITTLLPMRARKGTRGHALGIQPLPQRRDKIGAGSGFRRPKQTHDREAPGLILRKGAHRGLLQKRLTAADQTPELVSCFLRFFPFPRFRAGRDTDTPRSGKHFGGKLTTNAGGPPRRDHNVPLVPGSIKGGQR